MALHAILLIFVVCYSLWFHNIVQCSWNLSKQEDLAIERQLKFLNKPSVKTFVDKYGDIYDCVEFYKQLAFDHPLLKNCTFDYQIKFSALYNGTSEQNSSLVGKSLHKESNGEMCPDGSVPIRRVTKNDLIREKHALKARRMETTNRPGTYLAVARTKADHNKFAGANGLISLHKLQVFGSQFSTTRIKLQNGPNSIEAGWRIDPSLYGDSQTRFFVRTDVGKSHCFNTRCPGFVHTNKKFLLDGAFDVKPGGSHYLFVQIARDNLTGNWNLIARQPNILVGFWPSHIFPGPTGLVDYIEWGGAAYAPPGSPLPPMGSGAFPRGRAEKIADIHKMEFVTEKGETIDAYNLETYADDSSLYSIVDTGYLGWEVGRLIAYGGPGHPKF